jgi:hypothetical protein
MVILESYKTGVTCVFIAFLLTSCGGSRELANKAGAKVGGTVCSFFQGVGKGIDQEQEVHITLSEDLRSSGLNKTISKCEPQTLIIYFMCDETFKSKLTAKAFDLKNREIGRSSIIVSFERGEAKYCSFKFPAECDTSTNHKFTVDIAHATIGGQ